ncbi:MAG: hypothetical protein GDA36_07030 [Rhodobacteraceae bacterium]|nr:hypothetical protein [Paracoccaceae bacterium]
MFVALPPLFDTHAGCYAMGHETGRVEHDVLCCAVVRRKPTHHPGKDAPCRATAFNEGMRSDASCMHWVPRAIGR